jgi:hypothetical protein
MMNAATLHLHMICTSCGHPIGAEGVVLVNSKEHSITLSLPPCKRCNLPPCYTQDTKDWGFHE